MFGLDKYNSNGHFFFTSKGDLQKECNAPKNGVGVYLIYQLKGGKIELVYVGATGKIYQNGDLKIRQGGIYDRLVNGKQFGESRKISWKIKIEDDSIEALDVYWYETFDEINSDIPSAVEGRVLQEYYNINGKLPKWNAEK